jgi:hypothetical protein
VACIFWTKNCLIRIESQACKNRIFQTGSWSHSDGRISAFWPGRGSLKRIAPSKQCHGANADGWNCLVRFVVPGNGFSWKSSLETCERLVLYLVFWREGASEGVCFYKRILLVIWYKILCICHSTTMSLSMVFAWSK